jgi:branched-subunit amino acid transport protein
MTAVWVILVMAGALYLLRISGFMLADAAIPELWTRSLRYVPIATLTALIVSSIAAKPDEAPIRVLAALGAAAVVWRTKRMWLCIVAGMGFYWLLLLI